MKCASIVCAVCTHSERVRETNAHACPPNERKKHLIYASLCVQLRKYNDALAHIYALWQLIYVYVCYEIKHAFTGDPTIYK